jgi:hypothetical protein
LAAKGAIYAAHGPALVAAPAVPAFAPGPAFAAAPALGPVAAIGYAGYAGPLADHLPAGAAGLVAHPNGAVTPADTPSVVAARAEHLAARGAAYAAAAPVLAYGAGYGAGYGYGVPAVAGPAIAAPALGLGPVAAIGYAGYAGPLADHLPAGAAGLVAHPNGAVTPADTPSVVAARAEHLAARGAAYAAAAPVLAYGAGYGAGYGYGVPAVAGPAIAAGYGAGYGYGVPAVAGPAIAAQAFAAEGFGRVVAHGYGAGVIPTGPYGSPTGALVSFPNGAVVPADEPAVVAARAEHFAAKGGLGW